MLDTITPQLIHSLINTLALLGIFGYLAFRINKLQKNPPTDRLTNALRRETEKFSGLVADLEERFTRFQKRENMRNARQSKTRDSELKSEALDLLGAQADMPPGGAGGLAAKAELYKRRRGLQ